MALLEFLAVAAGARIVAAHVFQCIAYRLLVRVAAVRAVNVAVIVMGVIMVVIAIRAMDVRLLSHAGTTPK